VKTVILVPVKDSTRAKLRMSPVLSPDERCRLAGAMLDDLIRALKPLDARVAIVTDSGWAAKTAASLEWRVFRETGQISESASVDSACRLLAREKSGAVLCLPADIPLAQAADFQRVLEAGMNGRSGVLVPSWDRMGTNAVLRRPPDLFPSRFGHNSLVLHLQEALRAQVHVELLENPRIALDLDDAGDIRRFLAHKSDTATARLLTDLNIEERLG
jgi:2-phospho-L-lactate guanylyltransferase